jgi:hypothetical protein
VVSSSTPRRLELLPCKRFAALLVLAHAAAAAALLAVLPGWAGAAAALLVLALGAAAAWDRALLRAARSPRAIEIGASNEALCLLAGGDALALEPPGGGGVTRYWVTLRMRSASGRAFVAWRRALLVPACMMSAESARLLRLWARWRKLPGVAPGQLQA